MVYAWTCVVLLASRVRDTSTAVLPLSRSRFFSWVACMFGVVSMAWYRMLVHMVHAMVAVVTQQKGANRSLPKVVRSAFASAVCVRDESVLA